MMAKRAVIMHPLDNVATVVEEVLPGEEIAAILGSRTITLSAAEVVPFGFKVSLVDIPRGEIIRKYGEAIGKASADVPKGKVVHIHNLDGIRARGDLAQRSQP